MIENLNFELVGTNFIWTLFLKKFNFDVESFSIEFQKKIVNFLHISNSLLNFFFINYLDVMNERVSRGKIRK